MEPNWQNTPTHNSSKDISEDKGSNDYPENDVESTEEWSGNFCYVLIHCQPVIQGEQLEECDKGCPNRPEIEPSTHYKTTWKINSVNHNNKRPRWTDS